MVAVPRFLSRAVATQQQATQQQGKRNKYLQWHTCPKKAIINQTPAFLKCASAKNFV